MVRLRIKSKPSRLLTLEVSEEECEVKVIGLVQNSPGYIHFISLGSEKCWTLQK